MRRLLLVALAVCLAMVSTVAPASAAVTKYEGEIDGAAYRVVVPSDWNGTLVLWSHGTYGAPPTRIALTDQPATEDHLLARGYALAGSQFKHPVGWSIEDGLRDQVALLDWFAKTVGKPRRTVSAGESMGGATATVLAERNAHRFAGVFTMCGAVSGGAAHWNAGLDITFALKTLLGADIELVRPADPAANEARAFAAVAATATDPAGLARVALAGALGDVPAAFDPTAPAPTSLEERLAWTRVWVQYFRTGAVGPARADMESWAGGNPSWNAGVDYRRLLARSSRADLVRQAYAAAGLDLEADLDRLATAPRVTADPAAVAYLARTALPVGAAPWPVVTVHNTSDGLLPISGENAYGNRVVPAHNLRRLAVDRAGHCRFTSSEEITAFEALFHRLDTGSWPATDPATLTAAAAEHPASRQTIGNPLTGDTVQVKPSFTTHPTAQPPRVLPL